MNPRSLKTVLTGSVFATCIFGFCRVSKIPAIPLHRSISALSPGDPLGTRVVNGRWELLDLSGTVVGQLAKKFEPPSGMRCGSATVFAIVTWNRDASDPRYRDGIKCDEWEVVVPELVFEPADRVSG